MYPQLYTLEDTFATLIVSFTITIAITTLLKMWMSEDKLSCQRIHLPVFVTCCSFSVNAFQSVCSGKLSGCKGD